MEILDLTPPQLEWRIYRDDNSSFNLTVVDDNDESIDLSDYEFKATVLNSDKESLFDLDILVNVNLITLTIPVAEEKANRLTQRNYFDLQGTKDLRVTTFLRGTIFAEGDIS